MYIGQEEVDIEYFEDDIELILQTLVWLNGPRCSFMVTHKLSHKQSFTIQVNWTFNTVLLRTRCLINATVVI